ncbi:hypothetical protein JZ751_017289 [Albula glossodonta]|uniref:Ras-specific guanine nucleotide-releasing factor 1 n=1 Tax=Albula glossodonta TaxID=121402 RepID=A0A8T2MUK1_9TELE|nr:hypothetical protein JZ751_017289 [Albula glossodonta]
MQKGMRLNDGHVTYLGLLAKKDGTRRGCLSKKSSDNTKWHTKWFALLQNMLFYFENDSSSRPSGLYMLEGCLCDKTPSPKPSLSAKECGPDSDVSMIDNDEGSRALCFTHSAANLALGQTIYREWAAAHELMRIHKLRSMLPGMWRCGAARLCCALSSHCQTAGVRGFMGRGAEAGGSDTELFLLCREQLQVRPTEHVSLSAAQTHSVSQSFCSSEPQSGSVFLQVRPTERVMSLCLSVFQYYFTVNFNHDNQKALELRTEDVKDCDEWVAAITQARLGGVAAQGWHGCCTLTASVWQIAGLLKDNEKIQTSPTAAPSDDDSEIKKIKKVQSFLRGWMCRRKWKTIIQDYIRSPHAESMRKRNQVVFSMLEAEAEYVQQLHILVNNFLRPLRMAASSKKPPITHDDVSSIFLNRYQEDTQLHRNTSAESSHRWYGAADLFDILLPMLNIYQEFVRNHQYSLQILAHCKQNRDFDKLLKHLLFNQALTVALLSNQALTVALLSNQALTVALLSNQALTIPRYILTLHELLAHTPHEHVERNSLDYAKSKLEELSRIMHDEVSETENIRKNLAIERMIVEGCEVLLDTSQTFVRQGSLIQVPMGEKGKITRGRLGSLSLKKEGERQCFLFSKHLIICTRGSGGKLHLTKNGVVSLIDCTLMEEPEGTDDEVKVEKSGQELDHLDFKVGVEPKDGPSFTVILVASSRQEKSAWTSDISQACVQASPPCIDNIRCNGLMMNAFEENSKVTVPQMINVERLLERLTDLRFLSIDFLNTFLHSYRVFSTAHLFFASSQSSKLLYGESPSSPRSSRNFSSPPPLSITKSSSPNRRRKLSLNIPIITGGKALDLAALGCSPNGYASSMYPSMSPFSKTTLDLSKLYLAGSGSGSSSAASKTPDEAEGKAQRAEDSPLGKQDISVREECDTEQTQSDEAETESSPTSPKHLKCKNSSEFPLFSYNNGMVVSSCRELDNTRSALSAASAFAIATAGANEGTPTKEKYRRMSLASSGFPTDQRNGDKEFIIRRAATNRVLNVLRHWVSKHSQDFESSSELKLKVISFLEEVMRDPELLTQERKAAANIIRTLSQEDPGDSQITLEELKELAEGGKAEPLEEFFGQGWMKSDKSEKTPYIMKTTKHFNDISDLIATEILRCDDIMVRVVVIEKWVAVADICRCLHNYNATKTVIDKLQKLISHIIREIRQFQQTAYKIDHQPKAAKYLLDSSSVMDEESLYEASLRIEPKTST